AGLLSLLPLFPAALLILLARPVGCPLPNPHQPLTMEWTLQTDWQTSPPVATVLTHTHDTSPDFRIDLCQLLPPGWAKPGIWGFGCGTDNLEKGLSGKQYYGCPLDGSPDCGDAPNFYCARWGCETFATCLEGQNKDPWLAVKRVQAAQAGTGRHNPLSLKIKRGREDSWVKGKTWSLRLNLYGPDPGILLTIQRRVISQPWGPVGPNQALPHPQVEAPTPTHHIPDPRTHRAPARAASRPSSSCSVALVSAVFKVLNGTNPNITETCWLCLSPQPPFYNGVGVNVSFSNFANISYSENYGSACPWGLHPSITLEEFSGQGTCVTGPGGPRKDPRCAATLLLTPTARPYLLAAPNGTLFACRSGLTPCISSTLFLTPLSPAAVQAPQPDLCILTLVLPKVFLTNGEMTPVAAPPHSRVQRAVPLLAPLLAGLGIAGSAAVGAGALIKGSQDIFRLSEQVDNDLRELHGSIKFLEDSLDSLAEVALQNRRGLDLLLLKQGGLCAALDEKCCFYANHSGIIRNSLDLVKARLEDRERHHQEGSNWYQRLFNWSPWLTSLLSSLAGAFLGLLFFLGFPIVRCHSSTCIAVKEYKNSCICLPHTALLTSDGPCRQVINLSR
uniref:Envelope protein n=1 Tax=Varanus komodoensis TaxID=61221 RepID=A0A8D2JH66_VARKO